MPTRSFCAFQGSSEDDSTIGWQRAKQRLSETPPARGLTNYKYSYSPGPAGFNRQSIRLTHRGEYERANAGSPPRVVMQLCSVIRFDECNIMYLILHPLDPLPVSHASTFLCITSIVVSLVLNRLRRHIQTRSPLTSSP